MSSYPFFSSKTASDVDLATTASGSVIGSVIDMGRLTKISVQILTNGITDSTGTNADAIILQASDVLDYSNSVVAPWSNNSAHWANVSSALAQLANGSNSVVFSAADLPSRFVRVVLAKSGITAGTISLYVTCKHG